MKASKIFVIIASLMMVAGLGFASIGAAMGGKWSMKFNYKNFHLSSAEEKMVEKTEKIEDFNKIEIKTSVVDVILRTGSEFSVQYRTPEDLVPSIENKNGTLKIKSEMKNSIFLFGGWSTDEEEYIIVTIPENDNKEREADIETSTGDVKLENGLSFFGKLTTSTGDIRLSGVETGDSLKIYTSTGDTYIDNCKMNSLRTESSTGEVFITNSKIEKEYSAVTSTGDMKVNDFSTDRLIIEGSTSDITLQRIDFNDIDIDVSTGDIDILANGNNDDYSISLHTSTGDMNIDGIEYDGKNFESVRGSKNIKIETSTGDIDIAYVK